MKPVETEPPARISFRTLYEEALSFLQLEKGALYTTSQLAVRPGKTIRTYLYEDRSRLTNPMRYLAMCTALVTFYFIVSVSKSEFEAPVDPEQQSQRDTESVSDLEKKRLEASRLLDEIATETDDAFLRFNSKRANEVLQETVTERVGDITLTWMNVFLLATLPVSSILTWLLFRCSRMNFAEHFVVNAYSLGFQNLVALVFFLPSRIVGQFGIALAYLVVVCAYQFWVWRSTFELRGFVWNALGVFATTFSVLMLFFLQAVATIALMWWMTHS